MEESKCQKHVHDPEVKKKQLNRMSKLIGHLNSVKTMMENDEDCSNVLMQLAAVKSALNGLGKDIINEHLTHCITHAIENKDVEAIESFKEAIKKYF